MNETPNKKKEMDDPEIAEKMAAKIHRAAEELKEELSLEEHSFRFLAPQTHRSSRDYIVFEALDELQKLTMACLQSFEFCSGDDPDDDAPITRLAAESVEDWMSLVQRKLIETLADLIGLAQAPGDLYFRDFLLHTQLDDLLAGQKDMKKYYGSESLNLSHQIAELAREVGALEADGLEPEKAWYRKRRGPFKLEKAKAGQLIASFSSRLDHALGHASDDEKAGLGFSYGAGFGRASIGLHARPGPIDAAATLEAARSSITIAIVIGMSVLTRCQKVLGSVPDGENSWLRGVVDNNEGPTQLLETGLRGRAQIGNIVMAADHLAQVLEVATGHYGYQSYRVRYLSEPPLAEIPEDWHRAQHVRLVLDVPRMRQMVESEAKKRPGQGIEKLLSLDDVRLQDAFAQSVGATDRAAGGKLREATLERARKSGRAQEVDADVDSN